MNELRGRSRWGPFTRLIISVMTSILFVAIPLSQSWAEEDSESEEGHHDAAMPWLNVHGHITQHWRQTCLRGELHGHNIGVEALQLAVGIGYARASKWSEWCVGGGLGGHWVPEEHEEESPSDQSTSFLHVFGEGEVVHDSGSLMLEAGLRILKDERVQFEANITNCWKDAPFCLGSTFETQSLVPHSRLTLEGSTLLAPWLRLGPFVGGHEHAMPNGDEWKGEWGVIWGLLAQFHIHGHFDD